jgi:hypothetical protein
MKLPSPAFLFVVLPVLAASPLCAQVPAYVSPPSAASVLGGNGNNIPLSVAPPCQAQQVHSYSSFSSNIPTNFTQLRLRQAGVANRVGRTIEVELWMAESPNSADAVSATFANNIVPATEVNVFQRRMVLLPQVPNNDFAVAPFPFDTPFFWNGTAHVSWRAIVWSNSNANALFAYQIDAFSLTGSSVDNGGASGCQALNGTRAATHTALVQPPGGSATLTGNSFVIAGNLPALLTIGTSATSFGGVPLPFDLTAAGAPGCFLRNDILTVVGALTTPGTNGAAVVVLPLPPDPTLGGVVFFSQYLFIDPTANALGVFTTNGRRNTIGGSVGIARVHAVGAGAGTAPTGSITFSFGLATGLN